jgi:hypothetical protein
MKIKIFSPNVIVCWPVHVTWMAHEMLSSVHQSFAALTVGSDGETGKEGL